MMRPLLNYLANLSSILYQLLIRMVMSTVDEINITDIGAKICDSQKLFRPSTHVLVLIWIGIPSGFSIFQFNFSWILVWIEISTTNGWLVEHQLTHALKSMQAHILVKILTNLKIFNFLFISLLLKASEAEVKSIINYIMSKSPR